MKTFMRVAIIGIDGAGAFFRNTETPNIDRIFKNGAVSYDVLTSIPTVSAECWGSLLHGVTPEVHGLTNSIAGERAYDPESPYPSVFRVIRENDPDCKLASFCNWSPINRGIIEENLDVYKTTGGDAELTDAMCAYVSGNDPKLLFAQLDEVDGAGHSQGYGTEGHLAAITEADGYIGKIWDAYEARGFAGSTLFIVVSDHGGKGRGHGGDSDEEKYVMIAAAGKGVTKGEIRDGRIRDIASITLAALGYKQPESWSSRVPEGFFEE